MKGKNNFNVFISSRPTSDVLMLYWWRDKTVIRRCLVYDGEEDHQYTWPQGAVSL